MHERGTGYKCSFSITRRAHTPDITRTIRMVIFNVGSRYLVIQSSYLFYAHWYIYNTVCTVRVHHLLMRLIISHTSIEWIQFFFSALLSKYEKNNISLWGIVYTVPVVYDGKNTFGQRLISSSLRAIHGHILFGIRKHGYDSSVFYVLS